MMRLRRSRILLSGLVLCALLSACAPTGPASRRQPYNGPTQTMAQVVQEINANNMPLGSLWATHEFEANIVEKDGQSHFVNGRGVLLFRKPLDLLLQGKKDFGTVFEVGSNAQRYWLTMLMGDQTMWWGDHANLDKPCADQMPIRPDALIQVLGISDISTDFLQQPAPVMRFNNDADAYMFVWSDQHDGRWVARKEIWFDRATKNPQLVLLFDADGRIVLRAYLSDHKPVDTDGAPGEHAMNIATRYRLYFPDTGSTMSFHLNDMRLKKRGIPNDRTFQFPDPPPTSHIVRVDEGCAD